MPGFGTIWRAAIQMRNPDPVLPPQCSITTWYFLILNDCSTDDLGQAIKGGWAGVMPVISDQVQAEGVFLRQVYPSATGTTPVGWFPAIAGGQGTHQLPTSTSVEVLRKSGLAGRSNWGRIYLPWLTTSSMSSTAEQGLSGVYKASIESALNSFTSGMVGGTWGARAQPVVFSDRAAGGGVHFHPVTSYEAVSTYRSQGRRARRQGGCLPFPNPVVGSHLAPIPDDTLWLGNDIHAVHDLRHWSAIRSDDPLWPVADPNPLHWSLPGADVSSWGAQGRISTISDFSFNYCTGTSHPPRWDWPAIEGGTSTFPWIRANGNWPFVDPLHPTAIAPETAFLRREWDQDGVTPVSVAIKLGRSDSACVYINGTAVWTEPLVQQTGGVYLPSTIVDVTAYVVPGALNCIGVVAYGGGMGSFGTRVNPATCPAHHTFPNDFRIPWVAIELHTVLPI